MDMPKLDHKMCYGRYYSYCQAITRCLATVIWILAVVTMVTGQTTTSLPFWAAEGAVTLDGGSTAGTGNVLVYHQGRWGKVCDDGWSLEAAHVVCRALGHTRALTETRESYFGEPAPDFWLDDVRCYGEEQGLSECDHAAWGVHNCRTEEAAGVFCTPERLAIVNNGSYHEHFTTTTTTTSTTTPTTTSTTQPSPIDGKQKRHRKKSRHQPQATAMSREQNEIERSRRKVSPPSHFPEYELRLSGGRTNEEGRVEVRLSDSLHGGGGGGGGPSGGTSAAWGVICGDDWGLMEAMVVCKQAGLGYGKVPVQLNHFGGHDAPKLLAGIRCDGSEGRLSECYHEHVGDVICSKPTMVAGVICARNLPDLVPNATLLQASTYLQDRPMYYLQCAMEEDCAAQSAYTIKNSFRDWHLHRRRLLRFSSSTWNFGTADFLPQASKNDWEWHLCHMHYHSMSVFAHYDLLDTNHNEVAEGHKASFCLEDVQCIPGKQKKYQCTGYGDQGISVGCADDYLHDIDCQWIDITDVAPGNYIFKVHINPSQLVAELDFDNNAVTCDLVYSGYDVTVSNCRLGPG